MSARLMWGRWVAATAILILVGVVTSWALAQQYLRNGECYLMVGEGTKYGVYRLNNPAGDAPATGFLFYPYNKTTYPNSDAMGISVDLNRVVRVFRRDIKDWSRKDGNIPRQVLDDVSVNQARWGAHAYYHHDSRGRYNRADLPVETGRPIYRITGAEFAAGCGTPIPPPDPSERYLKADENQVWANKQWYSIPNYSWYQSRYPKSAIGNFSTSYEVLLDRVDTKEYKWILTRWQDGGGNYPTDEGLAARSDDVTVYRARLNGCLDGCGGSSGSSSDQAKEVYTSIAFTPAQAGNPSRTYLYVREKITTTNKIEITLNAPGTPTLYTGQVIGYRDDVGNPVDKGTRWIGVSLRNATSDWVYTLGTKTIAHWYQAQTGVAAPSTFFINAVGVSTQWNQKGGIVYAYDKADGRAYKFVRNEANYNGNELNPAPIVGYEPISLGNDIDDIKADGFGSLYYGKTTLIPAVVPSGFNMDTDVVAVFHDSSDPLPAPGVWWCRAAFAQSKDKSVFERLVVNPVPTIIGQLNIGKFYFARQFKVNCSSAAELLNPPYYDPSDPTGPGFEKRMFARGGQWSNWTAIADKLTNTAATAEKIELGVINVPTPPRVYSFPGYKSQIDIAGPYPTFPIPNFSARHTNQGPPTGGWPVLTSSRLFFYMVENYPLPDGPQDPNAQPDWNGNGFKGGFITTIKENPDGLVESSVNNGRIFYRWKLWTVEDGFGQIATPAAYPDPAVPVYPNDTTQDKSFGFYSPVGGKYILTCQAKYDWYNYDNLWYGAFFSDREGPTCKMVGSPATSLGRTTLINNIKAAFPFMAWATMSTVLANEIIPDDTWAAIPITVPPGAPAAAPPPTYQAAVERCDNLSHTGTGPGAAGEVWRTRPCTGITNPVHVVYGAGTGAGAMGPADYGWRMEQAWQAKLFYPIETTNNTALNFVAKELTTPGAPIYFNPPETPGTDPGPPVRTVYSGLEFRNQPGDTKWTETFVTFEGSMLASMPAGVGHDRKIALFGTDTSPRFTANGPTFTPPYRGVSPRSRLVPTDPQTAWIEIKASRQFSFKVWPYMRYGTVKTYYSPTWVPNYLTIVARCQVQVLDQNMPILEQDFTAPRNIFGFTGDPLAVGIGPTGSANPAALSFRFRDDNPWENATLNGLTLATANANRTSNLSYNMRSDFDLKPVFSKEARQTTIYFHGLADQAGRGTGIATYARATGFAEPTVEDTGISATNWYTWKAIGTNYGLLAPAAAGARGIGALNLPPLADISTSCPASTSAWFENSISVANLKFGRDGANKLRNQLPINYANNTSGYQPLPFYVAVRDSSGNPATYRLNTVLNIRDNIPPIAWGILLDKKTNVESQFPLLTPPIGIASHAPMFVDNQSRAPQVAPGNVTWSGLDGDPTTAPTAGNLGANGDFAGWGLGRPKALKAVAAVTPTFNTADPNLLAQVRRGIRPPYVEDNVEFILRPSGCDNAGNLTSTLTLTSRDHNGANVVRTAVTTVNNPGANGPGAVATGSVYGVFRGSPEEFPMAYPVRIVAQDNAVGWTWMGRTTNNNDTNWKVNDPAFSVVPSSPAPAPNVRTFTTSLTGFDSRVLIRTLDRRIENK